jgi:hypothetical protein
MPNLSQLCARVDFFSLLKHRPTVLIKLTLGRFCWLQALIQYADVMSASTAKAALEGHAIFEGGFNKVCARGLPCWLRLRRGIPQNFKVFELRA